MQINIIIKNLVDFSAIESYMKKISFAIIGSGPAGFYTSKLLARLMHEPIIHLYEKEICPFGLIRYGVAPDHTSIKRSQITLSQISHYPLFSYIGNYDIKGQRHKQLLQKYSGVIYAYGASGNSKPKWMLTNRTDIKFARQIVYWYNNHPNYQKHKIDVKNVEKVVIVGNGNVAIDIARIFLRKPAQLAKTEISENALQQLKQSKINTVSILGRRGVTHSAFALKEIRQLKKLGISMYAIKQQLQESMTQASMIQCTALGDHLSNVVRMNKRKMDFIKENFKIIQLKQLDELFNKKEEKKIIFRYLLNPKQINAKKLKNTRTFLKGQPFHQVAENIQGEQIDIEFDMLVVSTGFQVQPQKFQPQLHLNSSRRHISNSHGCVTQNQKVQLGQYAVGWCKNGPKGVLDQTLLSCEETFNNIRVHLQNGLLLQKPKPQNFLKNTVNFSKYEQLRELQLSKGSKQKFIKKKLNDKQIRQLFGL